MCSKRAVSGLLFRLTSRIIKPYTTISGLGAKKICGSESITLFEHAFVKAGKLKHPKAGCLGSQSVKTTTIGGPERGYDGGKKIKRRKRHILVDTVGLLMAIVATSASVQDREGVRLLLQCLEGSCKKLRRICVDG